jgi:hypothetical protein
MKITHKDSRNANFDRFVAFARSICTRKQINWELKVDRNGYGAGRDAWDLDGMVGAPKSPKGILRDFGADRQAWDLVVAERSTEGVSHNNRRLSSEWMELLKAVVVDWIFVQKNRPGTVSDRRLRPLRILAACSAQIAPWELGPAHVRKALDISSRFGVTVRASVETVVSLLFDLNVLSNHCPLLVLALSGQPRSQFPNASGGTLGRLEERKAAEKLPELHAFWELVRIVFTEKPQTFLDALRFDHCKILICTGFRVGESCIIPADWRRERNSCISDGRSMQEIGGVGRFLYIRNFAEKQRGRNEDSLVLYETSQYVPRMFEHIIEEAFDAVLQRTAPLRKRLEAQAKTGRLFPEFDADDLVPASEFYPRLSGNLRLLDDELPEAIVSKYRKTFDSGLLNLLWETQCRPADRLRKEAVKYFYQFGNRACGRSGRMFPARHADGSPWPSPVSWVDAYVKVGELEEVVRRAMPRKLPDLFPYRLSASSFLYPHELLFLGPKASLTDQRNGNLLDVNRYFAIGTVDRQDLARSLGARAMNLFSRYGRTEADRALTLTKTHVLRHLQNTELFRAELADTIISKRFNRRSVHQNDTYDHRSLSEHLASIELPKKSLDKLPEKARYTLKMISTGQVAGIIVDEFKRVQTEEGEDAALQFLAAEADGFHATPYGYCLNSFTVDPCPKHLECFNGCRHFATSKGSSHQANLENMEKKLSIAATKIEGRSSTSIGRQNQLADVQRKLINVRKAITAKAGDHPFPDGPDLFRGPASGRTLLDE